MHAQCLVCNDYPVNASSLFFCFHNDKRLKRYPSKAIVSVNLLNEKTRCHWNGKGSWQKAIYFEL